MSHTKADSAFARRDASLPFLVYHWEVAGPFFKSFCGER